MCSLTSRATFSSMEQVELLQLEGSFFTKMRVLLQSKKNNPWMLNKETMSDRHREGSLLLLCWLLIPCWDCKANRADVSKGTRLEPNNMKSTSTPIGWRVSHVKVIQIFSFKNIAGQVSCSEDPLMWQQKEVIICSPLFCLKQFQQQSLQGYHFYTDIIWNY